MNQTLNKSSFTLFPLMHDGQSGFRNIIIAKTQLRKLFVGFSLLLKGACVLVRDHTNDLLHHLSDHAIA